MSLAVCALWLAALTGSAAADFATSDNNGPSHIVNGVLTSDWASTGALLHNPGGAINQASATPWCSGTMIGCNTFLTAAHCVEDSQASNRYLVFLQHSGFHTVSSISLHSSYTSGNWPLFDIAVVHLGETVEGIRPTPISTVDPTSSISAPGTIVGFGRSGGTESGDDYGLKRVGDVATVSCNGGGSGATNADLVCWNFIGTGAAGTDSNTCNGDSGGPLFMDLGSGMTVAGVTSGGDGAECGPGDHSWDANVAAYQAYVQSEGGADLSNTSCGSGPQVGDSQASVSGFSGTLSSGSPNGNHSFSVGASVTKLVVTMNGSDTGSFDLYVRQGAAATTSTFDCSATGSGSFGECIFNNPTAGTWDVLVKRTGGNAQYQATATTFSSDPPVCGDNSREGSEECDGTDDSACPGLCSVGCECPAPVCGNDTVESGETCDGSDDSACPGECTGGCECPAPVCGDGVVNGSEECEAADDSACPGLCNTGTCGCTTDPGTCDNSDAEIQRLRSNAKVVKLVGQIDNFSGTYDGLRPDTGGFAMVLSDGAADLSMVLAGTSGWHKSRPEKGKFIWVGDQGGFRKVVLRDLSTRSGFWKVVVKGKKVPGGDSIDPIFFFIDVSLTIDGTCAGGIY
ncbi:MAG: secreted trypsin-like serine protease [Hyphomicrobiaceae bacterium]|jgi:secreted trypsin-like serine protease